MDDSQLTVALAEILGAIEGWEWRVGGPKYDGQSVAIYYGPIDDSPDRAVGVRVYAGDDDAQSYLSTRRAQLRFRGEKNRRDGADVLAGEAFAALHGLSRVGGISGIRRISMSPLGADDNNRDQRTDNYEITLDNTEASWAIE